MDWAADQKLNNAAKAAGFVVIVRPDPETGQVVGRAYSQQHFTQDFTCVGPSVEHVVLELTQRLQDWSPPPSAPRPPQGQGRDPHAPFGPRLTNGDDRGPGGGGPSVLAPAAVLVWAADFACRPAA